MRRFIRYLYEYEQEKKMRNVGFVKVEQDVDQCVIHVHGKGFRMEENAQGLQGIGRAGLLPKQMTLEECAEYVKTCYHLPQVKIFGEKINSKKLLSLSLIIIGIIIYSVCG